MILYVENPKDSIKNRLELINEFSKVAEYKINTQKQLHFCTLTMIDLKKKESNPTYNSIQNNKIFRISLTKK